MMRKQILYIIILPTRFPCTAAAIAQRSPLLLHAAPLFQLNQHLLPPLNDFLLEKNTHLINK